MQLSPQETLISNIQNPFTVFSSLGVLYRIDIRLSRNWVSTQSVEKLRVISTNIQIQLAKKNPISTKEFKQYQVSTAEPQLKVATLERS